MRTKGFCIARDVGEAFSLRPLRTFERLPRTPNRSLRRAKGAVIPARGAYGGQRLFALAEILSRTVGAPADRLQTLGISSVWQPPSESVHLPLTKARSRANRTLRLGQALVQCMRRRGADQCTTCRTRQSPPPSAVHHTTDTVSETLSDARTLRTRSSIGTNATQNASGPRPQNSTGARQRAHVSKKHMSASGSLFELLAEGLKELLVARHW